MRLLSHSLTHMLSFKFTREFATRRTVFPPACGATSPHPTPHSTPHSGRPHQATPPCPLATSRSRRAGNHRYTVRSAHITLRYANSDVRPLPCLPATPITLPPPLCPPLLPSPSSIQSLPLNSWAKQEASLQSVDACKYFQSADYRPQMRCPKCVGTNQNNET